MHPHPQAPPLKGKPEGDEGGLSGRLSVHLIQTSGDPGPGHSKVVLFQTRVCVCVCSWRIPALEGRGLSRVQGIEIQTEGEGGEGPRGREGGEGRQRAGLGQRPRPRAT